MMAIALHVEEVLTLFKNQWHEIYGKIGAKAADPVSKFDILMTNISNVTILYRMNVNFYHRRESVDASGNPIIINDTINIYTPNIETHFIKPYTSLSLSIPENYSLYLKPKGNDGKLAYNKFVTA